MSRILGLMLVAGFAIVGIGRPAAAQTLPASAIALTPGNMFSLNGLEIYVAAANYSDGGVSPLPDLFAVAGATPLSLVVEAFTGKVVGTSTQTNILCFGAASATCSTTASTYDLTLDLDVATLSGKSISSASVLLGAGSQTTSAYKSDIGGTETINNANTNAQLCALHATAAVTTPAVCSSFIPQTSVVANKDFGLTIGSLPGGDELQLATITEGFSVPEPASVISLLGGIAALAAARRKRLRA